MEPVPGMIDPHTFEKLNDVRRHLWVGGLGGVGVGAVVGATGHLIAQRIPSLATKWKLTRNTLLFTTVLSAVCFSYVGAVTSGKNSFAHVVYRLRGLPTPDTASPYQTQLRANDRELLNDFDAAFARRAESIRLAKVANKDQAAGFKHGYDQQ
jgi:hypothetical protein